VNHYCDIWFWRASDQAEVARHLRDRDRTTDVPDTPRRAGSVRSALRSILRKTGSPALALRGRPVSRAGIGATEMAGADKAGVITRGDGNDMHPVVPHGRRR
jgi:hypothetical protein